MTSVSVRIMGDKDLAKEVAGIIMTNLRDLPYRDWFTVSAPKIYAMRRKPDGVRIYMTVTK